jgi:hypothetical protein
MDDLESLKVLAGIKNRPNMQEYKGYAGSNISVTGNEKAQLMKKHNIKPGTDEWFKLWFSKPYLTGEQPV